MKKTALLIMAAGIGSRFGTGIKQLEPVGLHDEIIMDYSVHDAIQAGFNKIVFVIRRDIETLTLQYPIETCCGRYGGGVKMADWYHRDRRRLTPRQAALLRRLAADLQGEDLEDMNQILIQFAS